MHIKRVDCLCNSINQWVKTDLKSELPEWTSDDAKIEELRNKNFTPKGYFKLFFDDEVLNLIVDETNLYACQKIET